VRQEPSTLPAGVATPTTPGGIDPVAAAIIGLGLVSLFGPTLAGWLFGPWAQDTEGRELLVLAVSGGLFWWRRAAYAALPPVPAPRMGVVLFVLGLLVYALGRVFDVLRIELVSLPMVLAALLLCWRGVAALKLAWFPLGFLVFAFPLPYELVLALTGPLKEGVSVVVAKLLYAFGYPVARSGVVLTVGQYQLLVVEACAGLQTMFTLEAMGLLYTHLMEHGSRWRNALLAVLVVPVSFAANVVRVLLLALITYHLGDDAAQGVLHGFAGLLLFAVGLALIMVVDSLLGRIPALRERVA
jgi:exosortase B